MKVREFHIENAPLSFDSNKSYGWAVGANHGYAEACKDHQELVDALAKALEWYVKEDDVIDNMVGNEYWVEGRNNAIAVLAKYKGE